ncbi:histone-lysine N-methyltransferase SETMAR [Trichonephila clavata]|uniref:Histone-lysine N-methyltransferase SETMAR n=1 Tax=Trichonephila clavata TaxID=2740835 RepID=A0A8X6FCD5_TRICU|nr:histone-lysine N-methyltransferase SETMAR [Trichonephila clavata]
MKAVYSLCRSSVVEWCKRFLEGCELLEDDAKPGQTHHVITPEMIAEVNALVLGNHRITMNEILRLLGISTAEQRNTQMALSLSHLQRYHEEECGFPSQIVTGDETWCHHFETESKRKSKRATSPPPKKSKMPCTPVLVRS